MMMMVVPAFWTMLVKFNARVTAFGSDIWRRLVVRVMWLDEFSVLSTQLSFNSLLTFAVSLTLTNLHLLLVTMLPIFFGNTSLHYVASTSGTQASRWSILVMMFVLRCCGQWWCRRWLRLLQRCINISVISTAALLVARWMARMLFGMWQCLSIPQITLRYHEIAFHCCTHTHASLLLW